VQLEVELVASWFCHFRGGTRKGVLRGRLRVAAPQLSFVREWEQIHVGTKYISLNVHMLKSQPKSLEHGAICIRVQQSIHMWQDKLQGRMLHIAE